MSSPGLVWPEGVADRVAGLSDGLVRVLQLDPVEAARVAPRLIDEAKSVMAAVRRAAIVAAAGSRTHAQVAVELGVSVSAVNQAIVEHRAHASRLAPHGGPASEGGRSG